MSFLWRIFRRKTFNEKMSGLNQKIMELEREILTDVKSVSLPFIGLINKLILFSFPIGLSTIFLLFRAHPYQLYMQIGFFFLVLFIWLIMRRISNWYTRKKRRTKKLGIRGYVMQMDILLEQVKEKNSFYDIYNTMEKYTPIIKKYFPDSQSILKKRESGEKGPEVINASMQTSSHFFEETVRQEVEKERKIIQDEHFEKTKEMRKHNEELENEMEVRETRISELEGMVRQILKENRAIVANEKRMNKEPISPGRFTVVEKKRNRGLFETVLDKIFPSDENSFALICSQCNSHNGLTPKDSKKIFKCFHCKYLNVPAEVEKEIMNKRVVRKKKKKKREEVEGEEEQTEEEESEEEEVVNEIAEMVGETEGEEEEEGEEEGKDGEDFEDENGDN